MTDKFYSFERALRELNLREEELKRLVSEGEIRAFRDEDKMKFRKEDIDRIRSKHGAEAPEAGGETVADAEDLIFDEEDDLQMEEEPGMATAPISTSPEEEPEAAPAAAAPARPSKPAGASARKSPSRTTRMKAAAPGEKTTNPIMMILLVLSTALMLYGVAVVLSAASTRTNSLTKGFADTLYNMGFATKS